MASVIAQREKTAVVTTATDGPGDMPMRSACRRRLRRAVALGLAGALVPCSPALAAGAQSVAAQFRPPVYADAGDSAGGPLDVRRVVFGQAGTALTLDLRTRGAWASSDLAQPGRVLCIVLGGTAGRLCAGAAGGETVLRFAPGDGTGAPRRISAEVARPDARSLVAHLAPRAIGLPRGAVTWALETAWQDDAACAAGCADRVPDAGDFRATVSVLAQPRCFGAAARDRRRPCRNPSLRRVVVPRPAAARLSTPSPCADMRDDPRRSSVLHPCAFGVTGGDHSATFALLGDRGRLSKRGKTANNASTNAG